MSWGAADSGCRRDLSLATIDGAAYLTGPNNQLLFDGVFSYCYDPEGNRTARFIDVNANGLLDAGDTAATTYAWDHRNRLTRVTDYATYGDPATRAIDYLYDTENRWIGRDVDLDADGQIDSQTRFAYDGNQITLQLDRAAAPSDAPADPLTLENLSHRYLWNPAAVDQLMADEQVTDPDVAGDIVWPLGDHQGTIRDLAVSQNGVTSVANHRVFDSYGDLVSQTNAAADCLFAYTGRALDQATDLQNNLHRWYDASAGRWMSEDPIGFEGRDGNLYVYVGNSLPNAMDPGGLVSPWGSPYANAMREAGHECNRRSPPNPVIDYTLWPGYEIGYGMAHSASEWGKTKYTDALNWASCRAISLIPGVTIRGYEFFEYRIMDGKGSAALQYTSWSKDRQISFRDAFAKAWDGELSASAQHNNIPKNLLLNVIMAELIDFHWNDFRNFGASKGPGQLTQGVIDAYNLTGANAYHTWYSTANSIEMTAQRIDRQLEELRIASIGGGRPEDPLYCDVPALSNVPAMNPNFTPAFSPPFSGDVWLSWNLDTNDWSKAARRADPNASYQAITAAGSDEETAQLHAAALLTGILQWMNDVCPNAVGSDSARLYEQKWTLGMDHTPAYYAYTRVREGIWPI